MGDHTETVRVEFNPREIAYSELLLVFWAAHNPRHNTSNRQYRNAIFPLNEDQLVQAEQSRIDVAVALDGVVRTDIERVGQFYPAEDYHQKYYLRREGDLFAEFEAIYPDQKQLAAATSAARVNGYLGCNGQPDVLRREIVLLGLSAAAQQRLLDYLSASCTEFKGMTCPAPQ